MLCYVILLSLMESSFGHYTHYICMNMCLLIDFVHFLCVLDTLPQFMVMDLVLSSVSHSFSKINFRCLMLTKKPPTKQIKATKPTKQVGQIKLQCRLFNPLRRFQTAGYKNQCILKHRDLLHFSSAQCNCCWQEQEAAWWKT